MMSRLRSARWFQFVTAAHRERLSADRAAARVSAYVYGNLIALAAVVIADVDEVVSGDAALVVAGTGATTFLAHVFAHLVAHASVADDGGDSESGELVAELRDAVPIASSASFPSALLATAWLGWLSAGWAQLLAGGFIVFRIATLPLVAERIKGNPVGIRVLIGGLVTAAIAALVVGAKIIVGH